MEAKSKIYSPVELLQLRNVAAIDKLSLRLRKTLRENTELEVSRRSFERSTEKKLARIPEEFRETSGCSEDPVPPKRLAARQLDGTDSEWRYRGRSESEDSEPQPIPAPPALCSQKDEGFQRFYRAVVSPTHVRVTAGGRIVPNNRVSSPTAKLSKDKTATEGSFMQQLPQSGNPGPPRLPLPVGMFGAFPPLYPGLGPGVNPAMASGLQHYPFYPWQLGMNMGGAFSVPPAPGHQMHISSSWGKINENAAGDKQPEQTAPDRTSTQSIPMTAPSRPPFYNGHWMMLPGPPFFPYGMPAAHGFPGAPFPLPMGASQAVSMDLPPPGDEVKTNQPMEKGATYNLQDYASKTTPAFAPSSNPPMSSIRPSEITKRHIDILRTRLKYLEDQLSYNKHQINERAVEGDIQMVQQYIAQFEKNLEVQKSLENNQNPKSDQKNGPETSDFDNTDGASNPAKPSNHHGKTGTFYGEQTTQAQSVGHMAAKDVHNASGNNSARSFAASTRWKAPPKGDASLKRKSALPSNAAMAAPFQPQAGVTLWPAPSKVERHRGSDPEAADEKPPYQSQDTQSSVPGVVTPGSPYLIGQLPRGIRPDLARDTDYMYGRPLTEDERRARHMYWGKAPRYLQQGLPKFNGKDFFPPSPSKDRSSEDTSSPRFSVREVSLERPGIPEGGQDTEPISDPFQSLGSSGQILKRNGPGNSTQSECLPRSLDEFSGSPTVTTNRSMGQGARAGRSLDEVNRGSQDTAPTSSGSTKDKSSSDEADEDERELIFTGRRAISRPGKIHNEIWSNMLKKGPTSANAVPGAVSSTTAQGVLPHYAGHATASLTPTITNKSVSPQSVPSKRCDQDDAKARIQMSQKRIENCPPSELGLEEATAF